MKIEFLDNDAPECPLLRIYDFDALAASRLRDALDTLSKKKGRSVEIHELPDTVGVGGCQITAISGDLDTGVLKTAKGRNAFQWILKPTTWDNVVGLIEPFCGLESKGFQWLDRIGKIAVLISHRGTW